MLAQGVALIENATVVLGCRKTPECPFGASSAAVVESEFLEWTEGERVPHSKFVRLREDKHPREVVKEAWSQVNAVLLVAFICIYGKMKS